MDLSKRGHLTPAEKTMVSQTLQIFTLDGIAGSLDDMKGRIMFHGGTSISTIHGSPRWSEDLDFVISPEMSKDLDAVRAEVERQAAERIDEVTPGAKFELIDKGKARGKVRDADPGTVMRWTGRWEHPSRIGAVKIKTEFYIAEPDITAQYKAEDAIAEAVGIEAYDAIPAATLDTIWADKIMAMSARPAMKWRDVYDMGYVMAHMEPVSDDALYERLEVACASYRSSMGAIRTGLQRDYLATLPESYDTFRTDMETWLPGMAFDKAIELGSLETYHAACVAQIDRAQEMIASRAPELKVEEEDYSCGF